MRNSAHYSIKKLIKWKLRGDRTTFKKHENGYKFIYNLFERINYIMNRFLHF